MARAAGKGADEPQGDGVNALGQAGAFLRRLLAGGRSAPTGIFAARIVEESLRFVRARRTREGTLTVEAAGERGLAEEAPKSRRLRRGLGFGARRCTTLLARGQYQVLLVDAPSVPRDELKSAMRWRVKDLLPWHPDDAVLDVLEVPPPGAGRPARQMFVVAAHADTIRDCIERFSSLEIPLSVIEIPETAQRNLATYAAPQSGAVLLLHAVAEGTLVTISLSGELYFARWLDVAAEQYATPGGRAVLYDRLALELQRSLDHFERQYAVSGAGRLYIGPVAGAAALATHLGDNLGVEAQPYPLAELFPGLAQSSGDGVGELFHLLGACLREEASEV